MEMMQEVLINVVLLILATLFVVVMKLASKLMKQLLVESGKIENDEQRKLVQDAIYALNDLAYKTVGAIEQTTAKSLRQSVKDGKTDKKELEKLGKLAVGEIKDLLKPEYKEALQQNFGNINSYLSKAVESAVLQIKQRGT